MTKEKKLIVLVSVIALGGALVCAPVFAGGRTISMSSSVTSSNADYLPQVVPAPEAAKQFLIAHGASPSTISDSLAEMPIADRNKIRAIYSYTDTDTPDYRAQLNSIVYAALQKYLVPGSVESVTTSIGPCSWTVSYNGPSIYVDGAVPTSD